MIKRLLLSALCLLTLSTQAQEVNTRVNEQLSDAYIRSALSFMTFSEVIETEDPLVLAGTLLDAAIQLNPDNALAWSMRAELAQTSGDQDAYEQALVGYLDTGVDDDRARFDLIQFRLANTNTLDDRLREVETLLNSAAGQALSGPLRSQLATTAYAVASELLDEKARRKWAVEAARADPTNLEAAQTMLALVTELGGDEVRRGTATVNVIRAGPLRPEPRVALASMLAEQGAFVRAAQQYQVVSTRLSPEPLPLHAYTNWAQCLAMSGQDTLLLQLLEEFEAALNQTPAGPAEPAGEDGEEAPPTQAVDLPLGLALIQLAVLRDSEDSNKAQIVFDQITRQLQNDQDPQGAEDTSAQAGKDLARIAAVFAPDLDQAEQVAKDNASDPVALGWIALRRGDALTARQALKPHAEQHALAACGLALATGTDDAGKARLLQNYIESASTSSLAALAAGRAMLEIQTPPQPTTSGKALLALMAKFPEAFWLVDIERTPWLDVRMKIKPQRIKPLEPITGEITLWNTSRFPLAITEQGPINQKAIVTISASNAGRLMPPSQPIVIDLGRKFSLKAGERVIVDVRLDYHQFGLLRATNPGAPFAFDARLLVNPTLTPVGAWLPSGVGGVSDVRDCLVEARQASEQAIDAWLTQLASDVPSQKLLATQRLAALSRDAQPELMDNAMVLKLTPPLLAAYDQGTEALRAWVIDNAIGLSEDNTTYPGLLDRATQSKSKLVWLSLLTTHATEADADLLRTAIGRQDLPEVSRFAERQRRLLRDYAKFVEEQQSARPAE
ncbi:MAG: hypothetical protein KTR15_06265 [Phycisphaeraceae bacterium]|nr:hypothetical protein [Phycisphaeraceae bacterium]